MTTLLRRFTTVAAAGVAVAGFYNGPQFIAHCKSLVADAEVVRQKWKKLETFDLSEYRFTKDIGPSKVYYPLQNKEGGIFRLAVREHIPYSAETMAQIWWDFPRRVDWEPENTTYCKVPAQESATEKTVHLLTAPRPLVSPRDFAFRSNRFDLPGGKILMVQSDCSDDVECDPVGVRGNVNSYIMFEPTGPNSCRGIYAVNAHPNGWIPGAVADAAADDAAAVLNLMVDFKARQ
eukprot:Clim_evm13s220 gene=Clim_evmTU13s220